MIFVDPQRGRHDLHDHRQRVRVHHAEEFPVHAGGVPVVRLHGHVPGRRVGRRRFHRILCARNEGQMPQRAGQRSGDRRDRRRNSQTVN